MFTRVSPFQFKRLHNNNSISNYFHLALSTTTESPNCLTIPLAIYSILQQFNGLFQEPQGATGSWNHASHSFGS